MTEAKDSPSDVPQEKEEEKASRPGAESSKPRVRIESKNPNMKEEDFVSA